MLPCNCIRLAANEKEAEFYRVRTGGPAQRPGVRGRPCVSKQAAGRRAAAHRQRIVAACGRCSGTGGPAQRPGVRGRPCAPEQATSRRAAARRLRIEAACGRCSGTGGRPREALHAAGSLLAREQDADGIADWGCRQGAIWSFSVPFQLI
ncbi:hypothetical protein C2845_PM03G24980 [Panicum miliaceum]|uniref:Uncharacterized protein n=1 Tax=Panicum miliaceum TaxID=4540 RepID=A0A3L6TA15_PANMI|nr:hypothetical protein C2845_PM03G24980 [Panicum miliaceum]